MTSEAILLNVVPMLLYFRVKSVYAYKYYLSLLLAIETLRQAFPELCNENVGLSRP